MAMHPNLNATLAGFLNIHMYTPEQYIVRLTNGHYMEAKNFLKKDYIPAKGKLTWPIWYKHLLNMHSIMAFTYLHSNH
jgi:hypothetical protein